jgi:hypothetical protein
MSNTFLYWRRSLLVFQHYECFSSTIFDPKNISKIVSNNLFEFAPMENYTNKPKDNLEDELLATFRIFRPNCVLLIVRNFSVNFP